MTRRGVMNGAMEWARYRNLGGPLPGSNIVRTVIEPTLLTPEQEVAYPGGATTPHAPASQLEQPDTTVDTFIYLHILCVNDASQGLGIGGHFLRYLGDVSRHINTSVALQTQSQTTSVASGRSSIPIYLESSRAGIPVYERCGFELLRHSCHVRDPDASGRLVVTLPCMLWYPDL